jgi:hypothetical protein
MADSLIDATEVKVRERLPGMIMGVGEHVTIEGVVEAMLREKGWTLAVAGTRHAAALAQRLATLDSNVFAGAIILQSPAVPAGEIAENLKNVRQAHCLLLINGDKTETTINFTTPETTAEWKFPMAGFDARTQTRLAVLALEHVRRHLAGME